MYPGRFFLQPGSALDKPGSFGMCIPNGSIIRGLTSQANTRAGYISSAIVISNAIITNARSAIIKMIFSSFIAVALIYPEILSILPLTWTMQRLPHLALKHILPIERRNSYSSLAAAAVLAVLFSAEIDSASAMMLSYDMKPSKNRYRM